jgi:MFS family permease
VTRLPPGDDLSAARTDVPDARTLPPEVRRGGARSPGAGRPPARALLRAAPEPAAARARGPAVRAGALTGAVTASPTQLQRAKVAAAVAFAGAGLAFASWISRIPAVRDALQLSPAQVGLLLLCLSVGAVTALPLAGPVVHRVGPARAVLAGATGVAAGLLVVAAGVAVQATPLAGAGLLVTGAGTSLWDVAMNVEAADVETRLGRTVMPRFHAGFSLGTVGGALLGALAAARGVPVAVQLGLTAVLVVAVLGVATRRFLPVAPREAQRRSSGVLLAWRERRTLQIGLLVLAFAFTEGVANDWLTLAVVDGHGTGEAVGALSFAAFVTAMTVVRSIGGTAIDRWGRVAVLRATAALALGGLLLVVLGPSLPYVVAGALLWGAGAALGFPVGMSAAADDPARAAVRVSVVSSIGYTAFLAGPPLVGFLAEAVGVLRSLLVVLLALALGLVTAGAVAPDRERTSRRPAR